METTDHKIAGIILAAGTGSRMGRTKQLMPWGDTTILGQVVLNASRSGLHNIIVVLGHDADRIRRQIDLSGVRCVMNREYENGQSSSLIKGIEAVPETCDAAMFLLGDQPMVKPALIDELINACRITTRPILIPCFKGTRGNPVIIGRSVFPQIKSLRGDIGARALFDAMKPSVKFVEVHDSSILSDIDTPSDYRRIYGQHKKEKFFSIFNLLSKP